MKRIIAIAIIVLSISAFGFLAMLFLVDYSAVHNDLASLLLKNSKTNSAISKITVQRLPLPSVTIHDVDVLGVYNAEKLRVNFEPFSIFRLSPKIKSITSDGPGYTAHIAAKYDNGQYSYGKVQLIIKDSTKLLEQYPTLKQSLATLNIHEEVVVNFDLVLTDQYITLTNIAIQSKNIEGSGTIALARDGALSSEMKLVLDKISISDERFNKVTVVGSSDAHGKNTVSIAANIDSGGSLKLDGDVTHNAYRAMFDGRIDFKHEDINLILKNLGLSRFCTKGKIGGVLSSSITMTEMEWTLHNATYQMADLSTHGTASIKFIGDLPRITLDLNTEHFDSAKEYPMLSPQVQYFTSLLEDTKDSKYVAKFIPLKKLDYISNFNLAFINPIIASRKIDNISLTGNISAGVIELESIDYKNGTSDIKANATLRTNGIKPEILLTITKGILDVELPSFDTILKAQKAIDFTKIDAMLEITSLKLPKHESFGTIQVKASNDNGVVLIEKFISKLGKSSITLSGNVTIADPIAANFIYVCDTFDMQKIARFLPIGVGVQGFINTSGALSTHGSSLEEFLYNLYAKSDFITSKLVINGYGIDELVRKLNALNYDQANLEQDITLATGSGITNVSQASGSYEIYQGVMSFKDVVLSNPLVSTSLAAVYNIYNQDFTASSALSFYLQVTDNNKLPTTININAKRHGQDVGKTLDTKALLHTLESRVKK